VESLRDESYEDALYQDQELYTREIDYILANSDQWFFEMKYYLTYRSTPNYLEPKNKMALKLKSAQYQIIQGTLHRKLCWCYPEMPREEGYKKGFVQAP
jgi:hypothetical protein